MTDEQKRIRAQIDEAMAEGLTYSEVLAVMTRDELEIERARTDAEIERLRAEVAAERAALAAGIEHLETIHFDPLLAWDHTGAPVN
jgi:hypothetical protein